MSESLSSDYGGPSSVTIEGTPLGNNLTDLMFAGDIQPGDAPSYQTCKTLYLYHPFGAKIAENPIKLAQSKQREIEVKNSPTEQVKDRFIEQWRLDQADIQIFQTAVLSRVYGVAAMGVIIEGEDTSAPIDYWKLPDADLVFNIFDPLNLSGSFTTTQNPNSADFLKSRQMQVAGQKYHRSRIISKVNEQPIYLGWSAPGFGYTGRSVYQRALFPLKSFIETMRADDMVAKKAGVLIEKIKGPGSVISRIAEMAAGIKRSFVKLARTGHVITIGHEDAVETLNMMNVDGALTTARKDIIDNIAAAVPMPALLLNSETMGGDFHEGTEDAAAIAQFGDGVRLDLEKLYAFMDRIIQHRAWTPDFYATIQAEFPEYKGVDYQTAFYRWRNSFTATWPALLKEPESESIKIEETKLGGLFQAMDRFLPIFDPENVVKLVDFVTANMNEMTLLFTVPLIIDTDSLLKFIQEKQKQMEDMQQNTIDGNAEETEPKPGQDNKSVTSGTVVKMPKKVAIGGD